MRATKQSIDFRALNLEMDLEMGLEMGLEMDLEKDQRLRAYRL